MAKAADNKMVETMAFELSPYGINVVSLYPGLVRTESVMSHAQFFDLSNSESPEFTGRVIACLYSDPDIGQKNGKANVVAQLAREYGITDIDGKSPVPLTKESCK
jgi:NAD(P)-dependent dehydrogenase (short-subunit alcohol dehydrogenase family)